MVLYPQYLCGPESGKPGALRIPPTFNYAYDVLDVLAAQTPGAEALRWVHPGGQVRSFSFEDLRARSCRLAGALGAQGLARGDVALLLLGDDPLFWPLMMALHRLGVVAAPLSRQMRSRDIAYCMQQSGARAVFAADEEAAEQACQAGACPLQFLAQGKKTGWQALSPLEDAASDSYPRGKDAPGGKDDMLLYFTSGTTGLPQMALHNYEYPLAHIQTGFWLGLREGEIHLSVADTGWSKSAWGKLYAPWWMGSVLMVFAGDEENAQALLAALREQQVASFCAAPPVYRALVALQGENVALPALSAATYMADPLHGGIAELFEERFGLLPASGFGQSETGVLLAQWPGTLQVPGSLGRPSPLCDLDVLDAQGASCAPGVSGELVIRTPAERPVGLFRGYRQADGRMQEATRDGIYRTGDIVWRDEWGDYWYVGRADDVIHSAGYRIGPYEVESVLLTHPAVEEVAVYGVPDPLRNQVVKASVVLAPGFSPSEALKGELQQHVRMATAPYKCPRVFAFVDRLPHSLGGKLRRKALREA